MIEVNDLSKYYGKTKAVDHISFEVQKGEILGFLGPNAAGKTTTMRVITGYLMPSSGTAKVNGVNVNENPEDVKRSIGYLAEDNPLYTDQTPREFLGFVGQIRGIKGFKDAFERVIQETALKGVLEKPIGELSKGYRQRVGLAQALLHNPEVLILDEPTTGLDPAQIVEIRGLIRKLGRERTVILSTHILPEVQALCERVIIIHKGKIVAEGDPKTLGQRAKRKEKISFIVKTSKDIFESVLKSRDDIVSYNVQPIQEGLKGEITFKEDGDTRERFFKFVVENNWTLLELIQEKATLEDLFLQLVTEE